MNNEDPVKLQSEIKILVAENKSLKERAREYIDADSINKNIIRDLQQKLVDYNNLQNKLNNKIIEQQIIGSNKKDLKEKIGLLNNNEVHLKLELNKYDQYKYNFEQVENKNTNLHLQLIDATVQLKEQTKNVIFLNEQISRMALLECLLADAEQEITEWKMLAEAKKDNLIG